MNILITGVHGFVGSNLVKYFAKENTIYGLDIVKPEKEGVKCTFGWDALDTEGIMPEIDAVIHLAGKAHDTRNKSAADVYFKVNTGLTQKIFDWYVSRKSMSSVVPGTDRPKNGKEVYIFRPCMIHGPGNKGNLNLLYGVVSKGIPWPLGAFENRRTFTSVENICFAVNGVLTKDVLSGIYNMGDDEALSTNELIEVICETLGKKARIWRIPKGFMNGVAKVGGLLHLPLNPLRMQKLTENYVSSNEKIKKALGIKKFPVDAREGLKQTIACFAKQ